MRAFSARPFVGAPGACRVEHAAKQRNRARTHPDDLSEGIADAFRAVENHEVVDVGERLRRLADDLRQLLGDLLRNHGFLVVRQRIRTRLDRVRFGEPARLYRFTFRGAFGRRRRRFRLAHLARARRACFRLELHPLGVRCRAEFDLLRRCLSLRDTRIALCLRDGPRLVRIGVRRLADFRLQLLFGALGLELGDLRLLDDDLLSCRRGGEWPGLLGGCLRRAVPPPSPRPVGSATWKSPWPSAHPIPARARSLRGRPATARCALPSRRAPLPVPRRCRCSRCGRRSPGSAGVDRQAEPLHLARRRLARRLRQRVAVPDHVLDRHRPDDRAQMAGEHVVHLHVHLVFLVEEAPRGVRDRLVVVGDLVDHDRANPDADSLCRHAVEVELGLVDVERRACGPSESRAR